MGNDLILLKEQLKSKAVGDGASLVGIADLTTAADFIQAEYGAAFLRYPRALSVAIFFPRQVMESLREGPSRSYEYFYGVINRNLDDITLRLSLALQAAGYAALPIPASQYRFDPATPFQLDGPPMAIQYKGAFSHRLAARLGGLGWIGKSCSLINPTVGPRLRLATVLTDALLPADEPLPDRCGSCTRCRDACPAGAIHGVNFCPEDPLSVRLDADACHAYFRRVAAVAGVDNCGKCLLACPWGQR